MIPLKDDNPTRTIPFVTIFIIVINIAIFVYQLSFGKNMQKVIYSFGAIPYEVIHNIDLYPSISFPVHWTIVSSMFMHGGVMHIAGNMLYLWIFGNNIEDAMGHLKFVLFYLLCGILACIAHIYTNFDSRIPMVGASGAVSGILGAYMLLYPRAKVLTLVIFGFFVKIVKIPAILVIGVWVLLQFVNLQGAGSGGVAWHAHLGGFLAGMLLIKKFQKSD